MNKLKQLDELILEVMQEKNLIERDSKKGGVAGIKKQKAGAKHLGINLAEILSIISLGTETGKDQRSSVAAAKQLITSAGFKNKRLVSCFIAKEILKDDNGLYDKLFNHMDKEQQALFSTIE